MNAYLASSPRAYREAAVLTATGEQLMVMLYDGARRFLHQAAVAMERALNLRSVYVFCGRHLQQARFERDPAKIEEVSVLLGQLREAWAEIAAG